MRKFIILIILVCAAFHVSHAQNLKFGHINTGEIIQTMPEYESARVSLEKLRQELAGYLETMTTDLNNRYNTYVRDNKILSDVVRQVREQELSDLNRRIQEFESNAQTQLVEKQSELFNPVYSKFNKAIEDIGKENGFLYIFDTSKGDLLYFDKTKSTDITAMVKLKLGIK